MQETDALALARHAILVSLQLTLPIMILSLIIGVVICLFQAVTSSEPVPSRWKTSPPISSHGIKQTPFERAPLRRVGNSYTAFTPRS